MDGPARVAHIRSCRFLMLADQLYPDATALARDGRYAVVTGCDALADFVGDLDRQAPENPAWAAEGLREGRAPAAAFLRRLQDTSLLCQALACEVGDPAPAHGRRNGRGGGGQLGPLEGWALALLSRPGSPPVAFATRVDGLRTDLEACCRGLHARFGVAFNPLVVAKVLCTLLGALNVSASVGSTGLANVYRSRVTQVHILLRAPAILGCSLLLSLSLSPSSSLHPRPHPSGRSHPSSAVLCLNSCHRLTRLLLP